MWNVNVNVPVQSSLLKYTQTNAHAAWQSINQIYFALTINTINNDSTVDIFKYDMIFVYAHYTTANPNHNPKIWKLILACTRDPNRSTSIKFVHAL